MSRSSALHRMRTPTKPVIGLIVIAVIVGVVFAAVNKNYVTTALMGGETRTVELPGDYFLLERSSGVKVSGVRVGVVKNVERSPNGTALVEVNVSDDAVERVGSQPSARLRPTTLLGGVFYLDIVPGGDRTQPWTETIPVSRTTLPVEAGDVVEKFQPQAVKGTSAAINKFDATLGRDGTDSVRHLVETAPAVLDPAARVLKSVRGNRPEVDLPALVGNVQRTSAVLTHKEGQLESILSGLRTTSTVLADSSGPISAAIERMPATFDTASAGLADLDVTLERLRRTAGPARPSVQQLTGALEELDPLLADAEPVVRDLRGGMEELRPVMDKLVPTVDRAGDTFDNLRGPVLDRINGPFKDMVMASFHGTGVYGHTASDQPFYKELGYMLSNLNRAGAYADGNGHAIAFQPGLGPGSVAGPVSVEKMFQDMFFPGGGHHG